MPVELTTFGQDTLRRLSDPNFGEKFNIRGDESGNLAVVDRGYRASETKEERDVVIENAAKAMAEFLSQADVKGVEGFDTNVVEGNLITLRDRMLKNATTRTACNTIETYMNRGIGSLNPTFVDKLIARLNGLGKALIYGHRF